MNQPPLPTGTVTFLFTDIQGSTPLWERQPEKMAAALQIHNAALRQAIEAHGGIVFKIIGDAFQAVFATASQALKAGIAGQQALQSASWNELGQLQVRMGLHTGEAEPDPGGDGYAVAHTLNRVARIMSAGYGGQILISQETADLVERQLPEGVSLRDLGEHRMKGMAFLEHLYQVIAPGLRPDFPALSTALTHPHNLPLQLTSFIGRQRETAEVMELLARNRLVTLTGSGGTGKTRLSLRVAEAALAHFPQGAWLIELAGLGDPELVPHAIAAALGLQESSNRSPLEQLKETLRPKQVLIILDNCEHVIADCARISEALLQACPKLKILASSREALGIPGEVAYHVPSLPVPDPRNLPPLEELPGFAAVQLFTERAASANPGFRVTPENAPAVAQICRRLDGIPLAIELAAARVGALSIEQIAARLDNRFRLLTGGSRTALPRQQTLRASIDWSYSLLDEFERLLLMRLSVFYGGWTLELAGEVCGFDGLDEFSVLDGLAQLVKKSLIIVESTPGGGHRYRRLETIRQYAREKLLDSGASEVVHDHHLQAYLRLAEAAEPHLRGHRQVEWLDRLEEELDNLRAALDWALETDARKGLRLAAALYQFWHIRGYRVEGEKWLRLLLERMEADPASAEDLAWLGEARARQSMLLAAAGRIGAEAARIAGAALEAAEKLGDAGKRIRALALHAQAWNAGYLGQKATLAKQFYQCLEIAEEIGDRFLIAEALMNLTFSEPDLNLAREYAERNLVLRRELGDLDGLMISQINMGSYLFWTGDPIQASLLFEEAIQIAQKVKNRMGWIHGLCSLGRIHNHRGDQEAATGYFQQALAVARDLGEPSWILWQYNALGCAFGAKKDWGKANGYFQQAIDTSQAAHFITWEVFSYINKAEVASTLGDHEQATQSYRAAVELGQNRPGFSLEGLIAYAAGKSALLGGDLTTATRYFRQALVDFQELGIYNFIGPCLGFLAVCVLRAGQFEQAARLHGVVASQHWLTDLTRMPWLAMDDLDAWLAPVRLTLGEAEFTRLFNEGQTMTLGEAVALVWEGLNERSPF